jgi:glucose/arabinose dehydrogenase/PKD repeat protein
MGAGRARRAITVAAACCAFASGAAPALAATLPPGFTEEVAASGFTSPAAFAFLPDGRVLVAEHAGIVKVVKNGAVLSTPFLDIRTRVTGNDSRGLVGMAVDPEFATNGYVYLLYAYEYDPTRPTGPQTARLVRFTASGDTASESSEVVLVGKTVGVSCNDFPAGTDCIPADKNHMGGSIKFATDGTIFFSTGDGADWSTVNDNALRAQDLDSLAGKLLHVDRNGAGLPANPFWNGDASANRSKVWAYGLRNPFRMTLRPGSDVPYIADVGWEKWEEVDVGVAGSNFGWPCYEGTGRTSYEPKAICQALYGGGPSAVRAPLHAYAHSGSGASITGGTFYSGTSFPAQYRGAYFYGDYARNWIRFLRVDANDVLVAGSDTGFATGTDSPVQIEMGPDGSLYYLSIDAGRLLRIRYTGASDNRSPTASASATPTSGVAPLTVQFSSAGSTDADGDALAYEWDFGDGTPVSGVASPEHTYQADGTYTARLTVTDGRGGSSTDTIAITVGNTAPTATIGAPSSSLRYKVGDVISFSGSASDPEDGAIPDSGLAWTITLKHCPGGACHNHPFATASGASGSFTVPDHGDDTHFEIALTATDSGGLKHTTSVTVQPQTVKITIATSPSGLQVHYDGGSGTAPLTRTTIVGSTHTIYAPSPQGSATFASWSDGGAQQHDVTVGSTDAVFTATFTVPPSGFSVATKTPADGQTVSGAVRWEAAASGGTVARIEFSIDGVLRWTERLSPYVFNGDSGTWDTTKETNGLHTLVVRAFASDGRIATATITVTVTSGTAPLVTAYPSATTVQTGTRRAGDFSHLTSDDNGYYQVNSTTSGTRTSAWYASFTAVPNALTSLKVTYKGKNSRSCTQTVAAWRWTTNTWVTIDSRSVGTTEVAITKTPSGTLADYVSGTSGDGEVRVRVRCTASAGFYASGDLMKIAYGWP